MRLDELIRDIKDTSLRHTLVNEFGEGDIYEYLNSGEHKYPCVFLTVTGLGEVGYMREVNITLFYVDRLTSDQRNRTSIQSEATDVLGDIIHSFESNNVNYTLFTEKFSDLCAGAYAEFSVSIEYSAGCEQNFIIRTKKIENNGIYNVEDFDEVEVDVKGCSEEIVIYYENQINHLTEENESKQAYIDTVTSKTITENGTYTPEEGILGWNNINVNVTNSTGVWEVPDGMKFGFSTFTKIPSNSNFSNVTNFYRMFYNCNNLTEIPQMDTSNGTDFGDMFYGCKNITTIPQMDTSEGTNFRQMFYNCNNLTEIPQIDTSNGTDFYSMFYNCNNITEIPQIDTNKCTNFQQTFYKCNNLVTIPQIDTSNGTIFSNMFNDCSKLTTISLLNLSNGTNLANMFYNCTGLINITLVGSINIGVDFSPCTLLTYESVKSILTACSNTTRPTTAKTLKFSRTITDQNGELAALIADCTSKKWTISGLTLQ